MNKKLLGLGIALVCVPGLLFFVKPKPALSGPASEDAVLTAEQDQAATKDAHELNGEDAAIPAKEVIDLVPEKESVRQAVPEAEGTVSKEIESYYNKDGGRVGEFDPNGKMLVQRLLGDGSIEILSWDKESGWVKELQNEEP